MALPVVAPTRPVTRATIRTTREFDDCCTARTKLRHETARFPVALRKHAGIDTLLARHRSGKIEVLRTRSVDSQGAGAARRLAAEVFQIAEISSSGNGEALSNELGGVGVTGSNRSNDDLKRLNDQTLETWGRVDVLVNSAGHGPRAPTLELTDDDWHTGMEVYFLSAIRPTRLVVSVMQEQKAGSIINISTFAVFEPESFFPTSGVFRVGLAAWTKLFSDRYAADNIRMNNFLTGFTTVCRKRTNSGTAFRWPDMVTLTKYPLQSRSWRLTAADTLQGRPFELMAEQPVRSEQSATWNRKSWEVRRNGSKMNLFRHQSLGASAAPVMNATASDML